MWKEEMWYLIVRALACQRRGELAPQRISVDTARATVLLKGVSCPLRDVTSNSTRFLSKYGKMEPTQLSTVTAPREYTFRKTRTRSLFAQPSPCQACLFRLTTSKAGKVVCNPLYSLHVVCLKRGFSDCIYEHVGLHALRCKRRLWKTFSNPIVRPPFF